MPILDEELEKIILDNTSGSKEILSRLNNYFLKISPLSKKDEEKLNFLKQHFKEFSAIENYLSQLIHLLVKGENTTRFLEQFQKGENQLPKILLEQLKPHLNRTTKIITLSNSKTLQDVFLLMKKEGIPFELIVSESRPQNEGAIMAEKLAEQGIKVKLITEAMLGQEAREVDIGIIGADKILKDGSVVNKTGSLSLAIILKHYSKPLFVLADKTKKSSEISFQPKLYPSEEIKKIKNAMIQITNYYFEKVDATLITKILSD